MTDNIDQIGGNAAKDLLNGIERIERLTEEKKAIADDIKDVFAEYKWKGFDVKTMRYVIAQRKMDKEKRETERALAETYLSALGLL